jgi:malonyl-CoA O-methyltransferase
LPSEWNPAIGVELDLEEGYRLWSTIYDSEYNPLFALEEREVERILAGLAFRDVLDAGAGTGRWALSLTERGAQVTAIDASAAMLDLARAKAQARGLSLRFDEGRLDALPYASESFDLVTCNLVLSHLEDFPPVITEFERVLRTGGKLIVTDFHPDIVSAGGRAEFVIEGTHYVLPNPPHVRDDYLSGIEDAGLRLVETVDIPLRALDSEEVKQIFFKLFGDRELCLVLLAEKLRHS